MGAGLVARLTSAGHDLLIHDRNPDKVGKAIEGADSAGSARSASLEEALSEGEIVVLAVWYPATVDLVREHADALAGKMVVDISNPLDASATRIELPADTSGAEQLAAAAPALRIVKAFNTLPAPTLLAGAVGGTSLDTFVASDDAAAKAAVIKVLEGSGLRGIDAGALENARVLERLTALGMDIAQRYGLGFEFGIKYLTEAPEMKLPV